MAGVTALTARYASANFTTSMPKTQGATAAGNLNVTLANDASSQAFNLAATGFYPGLSKYRTVDLTVSAVGTQDPRAEHH